MATFRVGVGSFNINDGSVGIGTEGSGHGNLKVEGTLKSNTIDVLGVSTFTRYSGFSADEININNRDLTLSGEYSTTGDIVVEDGASLTVGLGSTACTGTVESVSVKNHFSVPVGDTAQRNETSGYAEGTVRYNTDLGTMEFFNGNEWRQFTYISDIQNSPLSRGRAVWAGGYDQGGTPANTTKRIDFINVPTLGNSINFGELTTSGQDAHGCGSETRGLYMGNFNGNAIEYITIASEGDSLDFGDLTAARSYGGGGSSSTRGMYFGGDPGTAVNTIDHVQINTLGNALDFGDMVSPRMVYGGALSNGRVIYTGGGDGFPTAKSTYDKTIISSLGNSVNFGELIERVAYGPGGDSNHVRGVLAGGFNSPSSPYYGKRIQYITMSSGGNAQYFGDLSTFALVSGAGVTQTRAVFAHGQVTVPSANDSNVLEYITIASTGNAQDFGDLRGGSNRAHSRVISPVSDSHGGLGGY